MATVMNTPLAVPQWIGLQAETLRGAAYTIFKRAAMSADVLPFRKRSEQPLAMVNLDGVPYLAAIDARTGLAVIYEIEGHAAHIDTSPSEYCAPMDDPA